MSSSSHAGPHAGEQYSPELQGAERLSYLRSIISENSLLTREYVVMNFLATIVASYGLIQNSTAVVIGAMIIAMLLGPINGLALSLNDGNIKLLRRAGTAEIVGVVVVVVTALFIGKVHIDLPITDEIMARTAPNIIDLIIALAGGGAGAYAVVSPRLKSSVVGVAIATALVPPLCSAAILFAKGNYALSLGAFILFFTNLVTIQAASSIVFWIFGLHASTRAENGAIELIKRNAVTLAVMAVLAVLLAYSFLRSAHDETLRLEIRSDLRNAVEVLSPGSTVSDTRVSELPDRIDAFCIVHSPLAFSPDLVAETQNRLNLRRDKPVNLTVRSILTKEANDQDWLHLGADTENTATPPTEDLPSPSAEPETDFQPKLPPKQTTEPSGQNQEEEFPTTDDPPADQQTPPKQDPGSNTEQEIS